MSKKIYFLGIAVFLLFVLAQSSPAFSQRNYSSDADQAYELEQYSVAIDLYKQAYNKIKGNKPEKARVLFRLAECYRLTNNQKQAINWYSRVVKSNYPDPVAHLYLADALKADEQYAEAIIEYKEYSKLAPADPRGNHGVESCEYSIKWKEDPTRYVVENVKKFNTKQSDFAPYWADKNFKALLFTSTREGSMGKSVDGWTNQSFSDIYVTTLDKKGAWSEPLPADENINTEFNEGTPWLNNKANVIYFTRCPIVKKEKMGCQIYFSKKQGRGWAPPDTLKLSTDLSLHMGHPALSDDELTIYFSAEMPGGYGGKDIWVAKRTKKTKPFDKALNLGPEINTAGNEMFPYLRDDGVLYFSSNGAEHLGLGGLDIYKTEYQNGKWTKPENLKFPLNSAGDDFSIIFKGNKEEGFLSSNRKEGKGSDDIYYFYLPPLVFTLQGVVRDDSTKQIIAGALVKLEGSDGTLVEDSTDATGTFQFGKTQVRENTSYELTVSKENFTGTKGRETTVGLKNSKDLTHDFNLAPIPKQPQVLPDVLYVIGQWYLTPQAMDSLNWLVDILNTNERWVIELSSHTDIRPIAMTNDTLSQRRARSAVHYIVDSMGIHPGRVFAKGYGANSPRILDRDKSVFLDPEKYPACKDKSYFFPKGTQITEEYIKSLKTTCEKEAAHQLNRRTEFTVLREDFIPPASNDSNAANVVIEVNPMDNVLTILPSGSGTFEGRCIVNGISTDFKYDAAEEGMQISDKLIMRLLTEYRVTKSDFKDKDKAFNEDGSIKDNSVVTLKKMTIAKKSQDFLTATVVKNLSPDITLGSKVLSKFGEYYIDDEKKQLIFGTAPNVPENK
ncbi:MAG TPA: OmpA family protein [Bacteroidales bacterium]|nr:OmpA family protein [Bacteroidales bacterium]